MPSNEDSQNQATMIGVEEYRQEPGPAGIGGWLILPIIGLLLTAIFALMWLVRECIPTMQADFWPQLLVSGRSLITFECFVNLVLVVGPVALLVLLFLKRRILPKLMVGFYAFVFLAVIADSIGVLAIGPRLIPDAAIREEIGWSGAGIGGDIARQFWSSAVWIPYFLVAKRVKNTFVNPQASPVVPLTASAVEPMATSTVVGTVTPAALQSVTTKRPRAIRAWVLSSALIVTVAVLGVLVWNCAAPPTDESISTSARSTSGLVDAKTYADQDYGYSIEYPASWLLQHPAISSADGTLSAVQLYDPFGAGTDAASFTMVDVTLNELGLKYDDSMLPDFQAGIDDALAEEADGDATFRLVEPTSETTVAGTRSLVVVYDYALQGVQVRVAEYFVPQGRLFYSVIVQSAYTDWTKNQEVFDAVLRSFKPGSE